MLETRAKVLNGQLFSKEGLRTLGHHPLPPRVVTGKRGHKETLLTTTRAITGCRTQKASTPILGGPDNGPFTLRGPQSHTWLSWADPNCLIVLRLPRCLVPGVSHGKPNPPAGAGLALPPPLQPLRGSELI